MSPENSFILGVKRSKVKIMRHKNKGTHGALMSAGFNSSSFSLAVHSTDRQTNKQTNGGERRRRAITEAGD